MVRFGAMSTHGVELWHKNAVYVRNCPPNVEKAKNRAFFGIANRYHIWGPKWQKLPFEGGNFGSKGASHIRHFQFEISCLQLNFELE